jgi:hypothetical protein
MDRRARKRRDRRAVPRPRWLVARRGAGVGARRVARSGLVAGTHLPARRAPRRSSAGIGAGAAVRKRGAGAGAALGLRRGALLPGRGAGVLGPGVGHRDLRFAPRRTRSRLPRLDGLRGARRRGDGGDGGVADQPPRGDRRARGVQRRRAVALGAARPHRERRARHQRGGALRSRRTARAMAEHATVFLRDAAALYHWPVATLRRARTSHDDHRSQHRGRVRAHRARARRLPRDPDRLPAHSIGLDGPGPHERRASLRRVLARAHGRSRPDGGADRDRPAPIGVRGVAGPSGGADGAVLRALRRAAARPARGVAASAVRADDRG